MESHELVSGSVNHRWTTHMSALRKDGTKGKSTMGYSMPLAGEWILREGWFWPDGPCQKGHRSPRNQFKHCVQCVREYRASKKHFVTHRRLELREVLNARRIAYDIRNPKRRILNSSRQVAKRKGLPFNLELTDIIIPERCPVLGIEIRSGKGTGSRSNHSPSIDRIIPDLGYVKGNVTIISWRANRIKADASIDELLKVAAFYGKLCARN